MSNVPPTSSKLGDRIAVIILMASLLADLPVSFDHTAPNVAVAA